MAAKLQTVEAVVEIDGTVRLKQPIHLQRPVAAVVTLLVDDADVAEEESIDATFEAAAEKVFDKHEELFRKLAQ